MKSFYDINSYAHYTKITPDRLCLPYQYVSWKIGIEPYVLRLSKNEEHILMSLGMFCEKYYKSIECLYLENFEYRNRVNFYRTTEFLSNSIFSETLKYKNLFFRPDIVLSKDKKIKIAEIDALPGEIGIHCFLRDAYGLSSENIISAILTAMKDFGDVKKIDFVIDTIISEDEYINEYRYIEYKLKEKDITFTILNIKDYQGPVDVNTLVYRFFDMVHNDQYKIKSILQKIKDTNSILYPALKHYAEEKLSLSYVHKKDFEKIFLKFFTQEELGIFKDMIPKIYFIDKVNKTISPTIHCGGKTIHTFQDLIEQAPHIPFVLKTSAFSDSNSTSKRVILLENVSKSKLQYLLENYIYEFKEHFILQEKIDPLKIKITTVNSHNFQLNICGFSRITPFYFLLNGKHKYISSHIVVRENNTDVHLAGDATIVPIVFKTKIIKWFLDFIYAVHLRINSVKISYWTWVKKYLQKITFML